MEVAMPRITSSLRLLFQKSRPGEVPSLPNAQIQAVLVTEKNFITPRAVSLKEFEGYVNTLKEDLDAIIEEARMKFKKAT
jgi:transcriptional regulator of aromatic amino acid metabolism